MGKTRAAKQNASAKLRTRHAAVLSGGGEALLCRAKQSRNHSKTGCNLGLENYTLNRMPAVCAENLHPLFEVWLVGKGEMKE